MAPCIMHDIRAADPIWSAAPALRRSVAQWLEHRSPKPGVGGSSPSTPARRREGLEARSGCRTSQDGCRHLYEAGKARLRRRQNVQIGTWMNGDFPVQIPPGSARGNTEGDLALAA